MAKFVYKGSKFAEQPVTHIAKIKASIALYVEGWGTLDDGGSVDVSAAADLMAGVVHKIITADGVDITEAEASEYDGTITAATSSTPMYYSATSDNLTDKKISALINIDPSAIYSNEPDATIGTTTGSDSNGYFTDIVTAIQVDESDAVNTAQQLSILGLDPSNSSNGLYTLYESQL